MSFLDAIGFLDEPDVQGKPVLRHEHDVGELG